MQGQVLWCSWFSHGMGCQQPISKGLIRSHFFQLQKKYFWLLSCLNCFCFLAINLLQRGGLQIFLATLCPLVDGFLCNAETPVSAFIPMVHLYLFPVLRGPVLECSCWCQCPDTVALCFLLVSLKFQILIF